MLNLSWAYRFYLLQIETSVAATIGLAFSLFLLPPPTHPYTRPYQPLSIVQRRHSATGRLTRLGFGVTEPQTPPVVPSPLTFFAQRAPSFRPGTNATWPMGLAHKALQPEPGAGTGTAGTSRCSYLVSRPVSYPGYLANSPCARGWGTAVRREIPPCVEAAHRSARTRGGCRNDGAEMGAGMRTSFRQILQSRIQPHAPTWVAGHADGSLRGSWSSQRLLAGVSLRPFVGRLLGFEHVPFIEFSAQVDNCFTSRSRDGHRPGRNQTAASGGNISEKAASSQVSTTFLYLVEPARSVSRISASGNTTSTAVTAARQATDPRLWRPSSPFAPHRFSVAASCLQNDAPSHPWFNRQSHRPAPTTTSTMTPIIVGVGRSMFVSVPSNRCRHRHRPVLPLPLVSRPVATTHHRARRCGRRSSVGRAVIL